MTTKLIGEYRIIKTLGEGTYSKVKQAVNIKTGKEYAIKIIDQQFIKENHMEKQFKREIEVMSSLDHPGLIKLHEYMHSNKKLFFVLDLAEGGELFNKLAQDGPLPEDLARSYFQQLIDALDYMHKRKAIHRDLKPENLLLDKEGHLKIADFGLSVLNQNDSVLKTRCGTPNYVAPEVFTSDGYFGPPVDIWGAGVILYVMLRAALPFDAPTLPELANQIINVQIIYPSTFPPGAVDLLKHIIVEDPNKRYTIEQIRKHPWFNVDYHKIKGGDSKKKNNKVICTPTEVVVKKEKKVEQPVQSINAFELMAKISCVKMDRLVDNTIPINSPTSFSTPKSIDEVKSIINKVFKEMHAKILETKEKNNLIKALVPIANNQVSVRIEITSLQGTNLIEFCRIKGSNFDFLRMYRTFKQKLTQI